MGRRSFEKKTKKFKKKFKKSLKKSSKKSLKKSLLKKFENITNCRREGRESRGGREGGWRIVIPMPER
jgi:mRNA-degrading endonuclease RelE of RelBE toxin-antitoxin system